MVKRYCRTYLVFVLCVCLSLFLLTSCAGEALPSRTEQTTQSVINTVSSATTTDSAVSIRTMSTTADTTVTTVVTTTVKSPTTTVTGVPSSTSKVSTTVKTTSTTAVSAVPEPEEPQTLYVLSLGNSYAMDAHAYLSRLAEHEGKRIVTVNLYHSGCSLEQHYSFWKNNEAAYQYEENGKINWNSHVSLADVLPTQKWDVITLQESSYASCGADAWDREILGEFLELFAEEQPQARVMIHQTWAYADGYAAHDGKTGGSMQSMWTQIEHYTSLAAKDMGLDIIPCGHAMFYAQQALDNGDYTVSSIQRDGSHAEEAWGRYMLALVWYSAIIGEKPSNTFDGFVSWFIEDEATRSMIYDCAMNAMKAYYPTW